MNSRANRAIALVAIGTTTTGCAAWMSTQSEVGVSTAPDATFTQKADVGLAIGSSGGRVYVELGGGIGYRPGLDSPHADLHAQVGYESGKEVRWGLGLTGGGRLGPTYWIPSADPLVLERVDSDVGGGVAGHLLIRVPPEAPNAAGLYFGVAGSSEIVGRGNADEDPTVHFLATIGPTLRYVFEDSTESPFRL